MTFSAFYYWHTLALEQFYALVIYKNCCHYGIYTVIEVLWTSKDLMLHGSSVGNAVSKVW